MFEFEMWRGRRGRLYGEMVGEGYYLVICLQKRGGGGLNDLDLCWGFRYGDDGSWG